MLRSRGDWLLVVDDIRDCCEAVRSLLQPLGAQGRVLWTCQYRAWWPTSLGADVGAVQEQELVHYLPTTLSQQPL